MSSADKLLKLSAKLESAISEGDYYGALQLYRTVIKRKIDADEFSDAESLLISGIKTLLRHEKVLEGADLSDMYITTLLISKQLPVTKSRVQLLREVHESFPLGSMIGEVNVGLRQNIEFLKASLRWAKEAPASTSAEEKQDYLDSISTLHKLLAHTLIKSLPSSGNISSNYVEIQNHFLESNSPKEFANFLFSVASKGYRVELDLFLARAVLQLCCLGNLRYANQLVEEYNAMLKSQSPPVELNTPLMHFITFLLLTLERDAKPLFLTLQEKYAPSLKRDPGFADYLSAIGARFFGIAPPKDNFSNMLSSMMNMFGGGPGKGGMPQIPFR
jgi:golgi to ER traffic protein 4